jgi:SAM-dependent methyltransferase
MAETKGKPAKLEPDVYDRKYFWKIGTWYVKGCPWVRETLDSILGYLEIGEDDAVLETGCGIGNKAIEFAKYSKRVLAVDNNEVAISCAREFMAKYSDRAHHVTLINASLQHLPFEDNSIHKICFSEVIEHVRDENSVVAELNRVLVPGGKMVVTTWPSLSNISWFYRYRLRRGRDRGNVTDFNPQTPWGLRDLISRHGFTIECTKLKDFYLWIPGTGITLTGKRDGSFLQRILEKYLTRGFLGNFLASSIMMFCKKVKDSPDIKQ